MYLFRIIFLSLAISLCPVLAQIRLDIFYKGVKFVTLYEFFWVMLKKYVFI